MRGSQGAELANRFKSELRHIVIIHDFCHILNLVMKDALLSFPTEISSIVEQVNLTFFKSSQQCAMLKEIIKKNLRDETAVENIKRYVQTRWSSYLESLKRIILLKDSLKECYELWSTSNQKKFFSDQNILILQLLETLLESVITI